MEPAKKAKEIYDKMKGLRVKNTHRKKCALIAADEIESLMAMMNGVGIYGAEYWQEVKNEINKL